MQKITTYIILFITLGCGLLSFYRVFLSSNDLIKIDAKVLSQKLEVVSTHNQSERYGVIFEVDNYKDKIGIYLGTKDQSTSNQILNRINKNEIYSFFLDPTVSTDNGVNLGVREIKMNDLNVYKESKKFDLFLAIFFTLLSASGLFIVSKYKRTKNTS